MINDDQVCYLDEIIIKGVTVNGETFRPSDWVDRLCGMLAVFDQQKVTYSPFLRPLLFNDKNCLAIKKNLENKKPSIFNFIMQFAADNQLLIIDGAKPHQNI